MEMVGTKAEVLEEPVQRVRPDTKGDFGWRIASLAAPAITAE